MTRGHIGRTIPQRLGLALAVLALLGLSLLVPLHQAAGLMRERALAGFDISAAWAFCPSLDVADAADGDDGDGDGGEDGRVRAIAACPVQGIGKTEIAPPPLPVILAAPITAARDAGLSMGRVVPGSDRRLRPGQPRGPPAFA